MRIYRLITLEDWAQAQKEECITANQVDIASGFMHLSPASEVLETARRYFKADPPPLILEIESDLLGHALKMEPVSSRNNVAFPHFYENTIRLSAIEAVHELKDLSTQAPFSQTTPETTTIDTNS